MAGLLGTIEHEGMMVLIPCLHQQFVDQPRNDIGDNSRYAAFMLLLLRQFTAFFGVGVVAAIVHYSALIGGVEWLGLRAVPATLGGYVFGGIVSYWLNRQHTYRSDRPHEEAGWRFAVVAGVGFVLTYALMTLFVDRWTLPYLPAQLVTTGIVLVWSFFAHKYWSFGQR